MFRNIISREQKGRSMHVKYDDGSTVDYDIVDMGNVYYMKGKDAFVERFGFDLNPDEIEVDGIKLSEICLHRPFV